MFVKRNHSRRGDKEYSSVLLVQGERVPAPRGPGRPRAGERRKTRVVHKTLANLSKLPDELVCLVERYCQAERAGSTAALLATSEGDAPEPCIGPVYGQLGVLLSLARELGIERAFGDSRLARLALFLVLARVLHQGSRLSAVRWAETQAVAPLLGIEAFDEDDLYAALDWLEQEQPRIERELAPDVSAGAVFLYDVSSSYLEGQKNELGMSGYNRDGKRYKKQIVFGLLTDATGDPVSVKVYPGNTSDTTTVEDQVRMLADDLGAKEIVFVGDRGMVKSAGKELLAKEHFRYVTSLTDPEIRKLLKDEVLQPGLFDDRLTEVEGVDGVRYILRRNETMRDRARSRREDQFRKVAAKVTARNAYVAEHPRAKPEVSLRQAERWLRTYKLHKFVIVSLENRQVIVQVDDEAREEAERLDGCYVVVSDVPEDAATAQTLWDRYGDLQRVERDFRRMKTTALEVRPIFVRKATRTRGHVFATMLALKLVRAVECRVAPLGLTVEDALDRLGGVRLVTLADPELGLWRLPTRWDAPQREVLDVFPPLPTPRLSLRIVGREAGAGRLGLG